jgi:hypothetical protein
MSTLELQFTVEEIWRAIQDIPADKVPGPDGFMGLFYKVAGLVIKEDIVRAFNTLWSLDGMCFHHLNNALMILLKKKPQALEIKDFWPIRLTHSFSKLFSKVLATRLAACLDKLVKPNQSAFIKGRLLHDNFRSVLLCTKTLHIRHRPTTLLKVDIAKAFNTVLWVFFLDLLRHMGFGLWWRNWLSMLLSSASTKILRNGSPGRRICHGRGLRQGDPLSPMLFVLVMEALNALVELADQHRAIRLCISFHADDVVIFLPPCQQDFVLFKGIL